MVLYNALGGVFSLVLLIGLGYVLRARDWFDDSTSKLFSRLVMNISLPSYMLSNIMSNYDRAKLMEIKNGLLIPYISIAICFLLAFVVAKTIKVIPYRFGTFCSMFSLSNAALVGLAVNVALFGEKSTPFALLYYFANITSFWTLGVYGISRDGDNKNSRLFSGENIKRIFSPPLVVLLATLALVMLGIKLPEFLMRTFGYVGNMTVPISMMFIGMNMYSVNFKEIRLDKDVISLLMGRFVLAPSVIALLCRYVPTLKFLGGAIVVPALMIKVFIIQSSMPVMAQTAIIAEANNADSKYAALMTSLTVLVSMFMIPVYMLLMNFIY